MVIVLTYGWAIYSPYLLTFVSISESNYFDFVEQSFPVRFIFGLMINTSALGVSWFWYGIEDQREQEKRRQKIEDLAKEAELLSLRQKLQPHFLFNSLNSISALVVVKPEQARTMIHQPLSGSYGYSQASDVEIDAREVNSLKRELYEILAERTGQVYSKIEKDADRDYWMTAEDALKYGIIDEIIKKK